MTDLEAMEARVVQLERRLHTTRAMSALAVTIGVGLGVAGACTHHDAAPAAPPTKIQLRDSTGRHAVTIDSEGISVENETGRLRIAAGEVSAQTGNHEATLSATTVKVSGADSDTTITPSSLKMESGKHTITATVDNDGANLNLSSDMLRRAVELSAGTAYASVGTVFLPADNVSPPHEGQLSADKNGGALTVSDGKTKRSFDPKH